MTSHPLDTSTPARFTPGVWRRFGQIGVLFVIQGVLLFGAAGKWDWPAGWGYLAMYATFIGIAAVVLLRLNPGLIEERSRVGPMRSWDRIIMGFYTAGALGILVVAGLDERYGWSGDFSVAVRAIAMLVMALGFALFEWGMVANAYFATVARVQTERDHRVVTGGPYRFVRHPGYAGMIAFSFAAPFWFGSWWVLVPAMVLAASLVARTVFEDRMLHAELPGYVEYARRVRYRLIPGLW